MHSPTIPWPIALTYLAIGLALWPLAARTALRTVPTPDDYDRAIAVIATLGVVLAWPPALVGCAVWLLVRRLSD